MDNKIGVKLGVEVIYHKDMTFDEMVAHNKMLDEQDKLDNKEVNE